LSLKKIFLEVVSDNPPRPAFSMLEDEEFDPATIIIGLKSFDFFTDTINPTNKKNHYII
jgi:hypothetical protein